MKKLAGLLALCVLGLSGIACTQPDPIVILTTFGAPGSSSRATAIIVPKMAEYLGQDIEIEYGVGVQGGVDAPANERTVFVSTIGNIALRPAIEETFGLDPLTDLRPVTRMTAVPDVLIVSADSGIETLGELLAYTREHPGELSYSHIAPTSIHRIEFGALLTELGMDITLDASLRGSAPVMDAMASGALDLAITTSPYVSPLIESGTAIPLVVAHPTRTPLLPSVPTMSESGVTGMPSGSWNGVFVPAGSSDEFATEIFEAVRFALQDPGVQRQLNDLGMEAWPSDSPEEFIAFIQAEQARLGAAAGRYSIDFD
jgi:tripartite-type tricarboxylate transporter receptor subunit TctC